MANEYISSITLPNNKKYLLKDSEKTDENVKQVGNAENKEFPILLKTTNNKESEIGEVKFVQNEDVTVNSANGRISAPSFMVDAHVTLQWNSTDSSLDFIFA